MVCLQQDRPSVQIFFPVALLIQSIYQKDQCFHPNQKAQARQRRCLVKNVESKQTRKDQVVLPATPDKRVQF